MIVLKTVGICVHNNKAEVEFLVALINVKMQEMTKNLIVLVRFLVVATIFLIVNLVHLVIRIV
jgi:hypothetical protein